MKAVHVEDEDVTELVGDEQVLLALIKDHVSYVVLHLIVLDFLEVVNIIKLHLATV